MPVGGGIAALTQVLAKAIAKNSKDKSSETEKAEKLGITTKAFVTNAQITSTQNDYDPGLLDACRISADAPRTITGFSGGRKGRYLLIINVGSFNITVNHEDAGSLAANRVLNPGGASLVLVPNQSSQMWYDSVASRWRVV